jgi:hypothetical protein
MVYDVKMMIAQKRKKGDLTKSIMELTEREKWVISRYVTPAFAVNKKPFPFEEWLLFF